MKGRVHASQGGVYQVLLESGAVVEASLRGRLKKEVRTGDKVVIGDWVEVAVSGGGSATVEAVLPRATQLTRRGPGGRRPKVVAANLDRLLVVGSAAKPEPSRALMDRLLVIGEANHLPVVFVLNKIDLLADTSSTGGASSDGMDSGGRELAALYRNIGYPVLETSAATGAGLTSLEDVLAEGTAALVGPSGVGKSSLLNAIQPELGLRTGELSHRKGAGRHTTVNSRLIPMRGGGMVADTPGFSDVGTWGLGVRDLQRCFPEFEAFREECRFRGCTHLHEPDCRVRAALAQGQIHPGRFASYRGLVEEAGGS